MTNVSVSAVDSFCRPKEAWENYPPLRHIVDWRRFTYSPLSVHQEYLAGRPIRSHFVSLVMNREQELEKDIKGLEESLEMDCAKEIPE
jgi:hypothetical protein